MDKKARSVLYVLIVGAILLLGGIAYQIVAGVSLINAYNPYAERFAYMSMSRGSFLLIAAYLIVFISGLAFWLLGPYSLRKDRWFLVAFILFYIWLPVDIFMISLDIRFAMLFNPDMPLTDGVKALFILRHQTLSFVPIVQLIGYFIAIGLAVFRPELKRFKTNR